MNDAGIKVFDEPSFLATNNAIRFVWSVMKFGPMSLGQLGPGVSVGTSLQIFSDDYHSRGSYNIVSMYLGFNRIADPQ